MPPKSRGKSNDKNHDMVKAYLLLDFLSLHCLAHTKYFPVIKIRLQSACFGFHASYLKWPSLPAFFELVRIFHSCKCETAGWQEAWDRGLARFHAWSSHVRAGAQTKAFTLAAWTWKVNSGSHYISRGKVLKRGENGGSIRHDSNTESFGLCACMHCVVCMASKSEAYW